ncbi:MAG: TolC family protein [Woeseia sp.]
MTSLASISPSPAPSIERPPAGERPGWYRPAVPPLAPHRCRFLADLFPRFTLAGLIGTQTVDTDMLFEGGSETRAIALGIDWTFLDVGRVRARIAAADADAAANLANYEQTVLLALEETENALVRYSRLQRERRHLQAAAAAGNEAARLARLRFDGGVADFLQVLDAERSQLATEDRLVETETRSAVALVGLYRAMAGGWAVIPPGGRYGAPAFGRRGGLPLMQYHLRHE